MKSSILTQIAAAGLFAVLGAPAVVIAQTQSAAQDPVRYTVKDLGALPGGTFSQALVLNNHGLTGGLSSSADGTWHAALWYEGLMADIGTPGLGGSNSQAFGVNANGRAVGEAQSSAPNSEDFCGFNALGAPPSTTACLPFSWRDGVINTLPTLGGANAVANMINDSGEVVGYAENSKRDPACPVSKFKPVIWKNGEIQELPTYAGDEYGIAAWINDKGQVVGSSGACASFNPNSELYLSENHALLWEDGKMTDLGNLGGTGGIAGNHACAINNHGLVVGHSELSNDITFHGFLWTRETGMQDLGTLPGDFASLAIDINNEGEVVGASFSGDLANLNPRAVLQQNGTMTDLNTLIPADAPLYLLVANAINDAGQIAGFGVTSAGDIHAFLATPCGPHADTKWCSAGSLETADELDKSTEQQNLVLSESARKLLHQAGRR